MLTLHLTIRSESCFYVTSDRKLRYSAYSAAGAGPIEGVQIMLGRQTVGKANLRLAKVTAPIGRVYWITGLSGAGKTTIGGALAAAPNCRPLCDLSRWRCASRSHR
jgi:hypothetical protein